MKARLRISIWVEDPIDMIERCQMKGQMKPVYVVFVKLGLPEPVGAKVRLESPATDTVAEAGVAVGFGCLVGERQVIGEIDAADPDCSDRQERCEQKCARLGADAVLHGVSAVAQVRWVGQTRASLADSQPRFRNFSPTGRAALSPKGFARCQQVLGHWIRCRLRVPRR